MDPQMMAKQVIDFYRSAFDASYNNLVLFQDQTGKWADMLVDQATWLPKESKQFAGQWIKASKKGSETYKNMLDENFKRLASMLS